MNSMTRLLALSAIALTLGAISAPLAVAQIPEASPLRITEPIDIGGTVLQPGAYMIRVLPLFANRNILQITNEDRSKVYATVLSVPHALPATESQMNTEYVFYPATSSEPRVLRTWFAPDSTSGGGHDIVYPEQRAMELAELAKEPVVAYKDSTTSDQFKTAQLEVVSPQKEIAAYTEHAPAQQQEMAANTPVERELPHTASNLPLFATLGLALLSVAVGVRVYRSA